MTDRNDGLSVLADFRKRKIRQWIATVPALIAVLLIVTIDEASGTGIAGLPLIVVGPTAGVTILAVLIFSLINWRCPACRAYIGKKWNPRFCSKCGTQLQA